MGPKETVTRRKRRVGSARRGTPAHKYSTVVLALAAVLLHEYYKWNEQAFGHTGILFLCAHAKQDKCLLVLDKKSIELATAYSTVLTCK